MSIFHGRKHRGVLTGRDLQQKQTRTYDVRCGDSARDVLEAVTHSGGVGTTSFGFSEFGADRLMIDARGQYRLESTDGLDVVLNKLDRNIQRKTVWMEVRGAVIV